MKTESTFLRTSCRLRGVSQSYLRYSSGARTAAGAAGATAGARRVPQKERREPCAKREGRYTTRACVSSALIAGLLQNCFVRGKTLAGKMYASRGTFCNECVIINEAVRHVHASKPNHESSLSQNCVVDPIFTS